jgi:hypothetical protein
MSLARAVFEIGGSERQRLPNILGIQLGIVPKQVVPIRVYRGALNHPAHSQPHISDARLTIHPIGVPRNSIEALHQVPFSYISTRTLKRDA